VRYSTIFLVGIVSMLPGASTLAGGTGAVRIVTVPGDAELSIDGEVKGRSPGADQESFLIHLAPGEHLIGATKPSFGPAERKVLVAADTDQTVKLDLPPGIALIDIPGGCYLMGSPPNEPERDTAEGPQHEVCIKPFALGKYEVTFADWDACVADGGCSVTPGDQGWGRGQRPVVNVSWSDIQEYIHWLNAKAGSKAFRLPTEAEWEYAARAGTTTPFSTGACIDASQANFDGTFDYAECRSKHSTNLGKTAEVGSYPPNPWGIYDMQGNANELTADCWNEGHEGAPSDGSVRTDGNCSRRTVRGGSWLHFADFTRSAWRCRSGANFAHRTLGFRLVYAP
jgi:formylglycine-generating enzyme required for sulfatase activity